MKNVSKLLFVFIILQFFVESGFSQSTSDTAKIDVLIAKNKSEEEDLKLQLAQLTSAKKKDEIERQIALKLYKSQVLGNLNKIKDQYIEGSNVLISIIDNTNDLNTLVTYGNARSSFLELVNPLNYTDFNNSLSSIKGGLDAGKQAPFWTAATDLISNFQNFVANPSAIIPGLIGAAQKFGSKKEIIEKAQYDLQKSIAFISALYSSFEQLDKDDNDLNAVLTDYSKKIVTYFPNYYSEFNEGDISYQTLGHPMTSQKNIKDAYKDRVINHFNIIFDKIDKFDGGIEALKQQEAIMLSDRKIKFIKNSIQQLNEYLIEFDSNREMVIDRIIIFRELTKSYSRAKGLNYSKDNSLQQTITVLQSFKNGGYQIQNSSRQSIAERIN